MVKRYHLAVGSHQGRPIHWKVDLACGHTEKVRVRWTRSPTKNEIRDLLRDMKAQDREPDLLPEGFAARLQIVAPFNKNREAACRRCKRPSLLDRLAGVL